MLYIGPLAIQALHPHSRVRCHGHQEVSLSRCWSSAVPASQLRLHRAGAPTWGVSQRIMPCCLLWQLLPLGEHGGATKITPQTWQTAQSKQTCSIYSVGAASQITFHDRRTKCNCTMGWLRVDGVERIQDETSAQIGRPFAIRSSASEATTSRS